MTIDLKSAIAQVKAAYIISDYIRQSGVKLTGSGGKWKGLCPFHSETNPSFTVSDNFQNYRCFSCGANGDLIGFLKDSQHIEFMEALKQLAEDKGIELNLEKNDDGVDYRTLRECLRETANFFAQNYHKLPADHRARLQVTDRGLSEKKMLYGYAPEKRTALYDHLKSKGFSEDAMLQAGVVSKWEESGKFSDFWSGRLMFFITDITGKPIGFSGRKLFDEDKRGKFVNSQAGPLFDKSSALFNIQNAKNTATTAGEIFVAEGQFDVAAFIEAGAPQVVAASGTAFTQQQGGILQRLVGENGRVVFAFDGDAAGISAAMKIFKNVPGIHSSSWVVSFPEGLDPCDYRLREGNEKFLEHISKQIPLVEFVLETTKGNYDMKGALGRASYLEQAARILKTIASNTVREEYIRKVALDTFTEVSVVKEQVASAQPVELSAMENAPLQPSESPALIEDSVDVMEKIKTDEAYALAARFLALAVRDSELIQYLPKNKGRLPREFATTVEELVAHELGSPIIPEAFTESQLMSYLSSSRLFTLAHLGGFNAHEQFEYIFKRYMEVVKNRHDDDIYGRMHSILAESDGGQIELLEKAIEAETNLMESDKAIGS